MHYLGYYIRWIMIAWYKCCIHICHRCHCVIVHVLYTCVHVSLCYCTCVIHMCTCVTVLLYMCYTHVCTCVTVLLYMCYTHVCTCVTVLLYGKRIRRVHQNIVMILNNQLLYVGKFWRGKFLANHYWWSIWRGKIWRICWQSSVISRNVTKATKVRRWRKLRSI